MSGGTENMKLETSLIPNRAKPETMTAPAANAGNAEMVRNLASRLGVIQMYCGSQLTQSSVPFLQGIEGLEWERLLRGSESRRMDDHQKYRLGMRWASRFIRTEW
jgi:hypothetical protein